MGQCGRGALACAGRDKLVVDLRHEGRQPLVGLLLMLGCRVNAEWIAMERDGIGNRGNQMRLVAEKKGELWAASRVKTTKQESSQKEALLMRLYL